MMGANLTSDGIRDDSIRQSIPIYLKDGETAEGMIGQFGGDLIKTIQFLRERDFSQIKPYAKPTTKVVSKAEPKAGKNVKSANKSKPKPQPDQGNLF